MFDVLSSPRLRFPVVCNPSSAPDDHQLFPSSKDSSKAGRLRFIIFWDCVFHSYVSHLYVLASWALWEQKQPIPVEEKQVQSLGQCLHSRTDIGFTLISESILLILIPFSLEVLTFCPCCPGEYLDLKLVVSSHLTWSDVCAGCRVCRGSTVHGHIWNTACQPVCVLYTSVHYYPLALMRKDSGSGSHPIPLFLLLGLTARSINARWRVLDVTGHPQRWRCTNQPASPLCLHQIPPVGSIWPFAL